jgi:hypothetical protein
MKDGKIKKVQDIITFHEGKKANNVKKVVRYIKRYGDNLDKAHEAALKCLALKG